MTNFGSKNFFLEVGLGNVLGFTSFIIPGRKDGVSMTSLDDITQIPGTMIIPDPGGIQLEIVSSSALDTAAGIGIQTTEIHYLDTSFVEQTEIVIMNGTTPVNTVATDINRVQWIRADAVGLNTVSVGNISLRDTAGVVTYEYIQAGGNQSLTCRYHVPAKRIALIVYWNCSAITRKVDFRLRATSDRLTGKLVPGVFLFQDAIVLDDAPSPTELLAIKPIPPTATIKVSALSSGAGGDAGASFQIIVFELPDE